MVTTTIMKTQTLLFIVVVALVVMLVNPCIAQFSTAARSRHIQNRMEAPKGLFGDSNKLSSSSSPLPPPQSMTSSNNDKVVIINFDDSHKSEYTYAKPILDKYGFKATFFEVCNWVEAGYHESDISTTWENIAALQQDGMDIESHTMTHPKLNDLSQADLDYERAIATMFN
jgi:peptidoglycan/xylan/chitin deacetylase (PgdA/CDA1 family)